MSQNHVQRDDPRINDGPSPGWLRDWASSLRAGVDELDAFTPLLLNAVVRVHDAPGAKVAIQRAVASAVAQGYLSMAADKLLGLADLLDARTTPPTWH